MNYRNLFGDRRVFSFIARCYYVLLFTGLTLVANGQLLKVAVVGLSHDHAHAIMQQYRKGEVILLGIAEPDGPLVERYKKLYGLPDSILFNNMGTMLSRIKPEVVLSYNAISEHLDVVEVCAPKGI